MAKKKIDQKKVGPAKPKKGSPQFGSAKGKFVVAPDFEDIPEDFEAYVG